MKFEKYQHIERIGNEEVIGIENGVCYVFPKIDGSCGSVWWDDGVRAGSRRREVSLDKDNQGFYEHILNNEKYELFLKENKDLMLYGEWLVRHSLKTYRDDAWNKFYVFDVCGFDGENLIYLSYKDYVDVLLYYDIDFIPCQKIIKNPTYEMLVKELENNNFLIKDGEGFGEGIVIKNYEFKNKYNRTTWGKIVTSEFKEKHQKEMGAPEINNNVIEEEIVEKFITTAFVEKVYEKIRNENDGWTSKYIPRLLETVFYDLIQEETWEILKIFKNPIIDFGRLRYFVIIKVKQIKKELF
jgi:hypothetical protein